MTLRITGTGKLGEDIACLFLVKQGFSIVEQNYNQKWGEIDIVAKSKKGLYFIEVKAVTHENNAYISRETDSFRPEDNVHSWKLKRLGRAIQTYLSEKRVSRDTSWKFGVISVVLSLKDKKAQVKFLKDIILE